MDLDKDFYLLCEGPENIFVRWFYLYTCCFLCLSTAGDVTRLWHFVGELVIDHVIGGFGLLSIAHVVLLSPALQNDSEVLAPYDHTPVTMSTPRNLAPNKVLNSDVALCVGSDCILHTSQVILVFPRLKGFLSIISVDIDVSFSIYTARTA